MRRTLVIARLGMDGSARVLSRLANCWAERGDEVTLVSLLADTPYYPLHPDVQLRRLVLGPARKQFLSGLWALRRALVDAAPDVILVFGDRAAVFTLLAAVGVGAPVVVSERRDPERFPVGRRGWRALRRALYPRAAALVVQTQAVTGRYPAAWWSRMAVIPNPVVAAQEQARSTGDDAHQIVAVGRLAQEKGFDLLLQSFSRVAPLHPEWTLTIWGEGPERDWLERLRYDLELVDRVALPGATADVPCALAAADLFVLPSRSEGFPNALCEALAAGLPVIAFDCWDGPRELIRHGIDGLLVPPEDVAALATALERLMTDPEERRRMSAATAAAAQRFSLECVMAQWDGVIAGVVEDRRDRAPHAAGAERGGR